MSSRNPHILLVEGKGAQADSLVHYLTKKWHDIATVQTGSEAQASASLNQPDVIIFDASTMRSSGVRSCQRLRKTLPEVPLIYIQGAGLPAVDKTGADITLEKPFTARKLLNRVRQLLPANDSADQIVRLGHLTLYRGKGAVSIEGKGEFPMTPKLVNLLEVFMAHPQEVMSRKQLMEAVWDTSYIGDTRTLDVHIRWLRQIIEKEPKSPEVLMTVRGVGYVLQLS